MRLKRFLIVAGVMVCAAVAYAALPPGFSLTGTTGEVKNTIDVVIFDADNDGDMDHAAINYDTTNTWTLDMYLNNGGDAGFSASTFGSALGATGVSAGDVDLDGDVDLVVTRNFGSANVSLYKNDGTGTSWTLTNIAITGTLDSELADVDGDGDVDLVLVKSGGYVNAVMTNDGQGSFTNMLSPLPAAVDNGLAPADFDGDGDIDLAMLIGGGTTLSVQANNGTGTFVQIESQFLPTQMTALVAGDINGDGIIDIVGTDGNGDFFGWLNNGTGDFATMLGPWSSTVDNLALGDVDNDGDLDAILAGNAGVSEFWLNNGLGTFTFQQGNALVTCSRTVALGDMNNDGDLDYILGNDATTCDGSGGANAYYGSNQESILVNAAPTAPTSDFSATASANAVAFSPVYGIMGLNDASIGSMAWTNPTNVISSDNLYATNDLTGVATSNYLVISSFGFSIPNGTVITGIVVEIEKRAQTPGTTIQDESVRLLKGGVISGSDKASVSDWPTAVDMLIPYGGPTDLWGQTWTATDINSGIGVAIAADKASGAGTTTAYVDSARITVYYASGANILLSWGSGSDSVTPTRQLQYQTRVGTVAAGRDVISEKSASPTYADRLMPANRSRQRLVRRLACDQTYYWAVRTVDNGFRVGAESAEQTFTVGADCTVGGGGGTSGGTSGGGGSSSSAAGGGGGGFWLQNLLQEGGSAETPKGKISGQLFVDVNANGKKEKGERAAFAGVRVEATGKDLSGKDVTQAVAVGTAGTFEMSLPAGTYTLSTVDVSGALNGYEATGKAWEVTVQPGLTAVVGFGWRSEKLLSYKPCLSIGEVETAQGTLAQGILAGIRTIYDQPLMREAPAGPLVTRKEFFELLAGTQCLKLAKTGDALREGLRGAAKEHGWAQATLKDVPVPEGQTEGWHASVYALLSAGVPVGRTVGTELVADAGAPVTKREAMAMVAAALKLEPNTEVSLPPDGTEDDAKAGTFGALKKAGVLPRGFENALSGGVTPSEAADLLVKASFAGGKLTLSALPDEDRWDYSFEAPYLAAAGQIDRRPCMVQEPERATSVRAEILPSAPDFLFERLQLLLSVGIDDGEGRTRWLINGRPSEYGVKAGMIGLSAGKPVTWLALADVGLKFTCHPLESHQEAEKRLSGGGVNISGGGTAERIFAPDRLFGTQDGSSFASRVLHSLQRAVQRFNLRPDTFAQDMALEEPRDFSSTVSLTDASRLLASYILYTRVDAGAMTRLEAEGTYNELRTSILRELTGLDEGEMWRMGNAGNGQALTWGQLITVLSDVLGPELQETPLPEISTGEAWWGVVR